MSKTRAAAPEASTIRMLSASTTTIASVELTPTTLQEVVELAASGELETGLASALTTVHAEANDARFAAIARLIAEWRPVALVVGIPTHLDGREHELTARCRRFANQLHGRHALPVFTADERLSSVAAEAELAEAGRKDWRERKAALDAAAARILLQTFLDTRRHERP